MTTYKIEIELDNAAFEHEGYEVARILRALAVKCDTAGRAVHLETLRDINGNTVGEAKRIKE